MRRPAESNSRAKRLKGPGTTSVVARFQFPRVFGNRNGPPKEASRGVKWAGQKGQPRNEQHKYVVTSKKKYLTGRTTEVQKY